MSTRYDRFDNSFWPTLSLFPTPAKAWVTVTIIIMGIAMGGALGQIIVHDIIPTFFSERISGGHTEHEMKVSELSDEEAPERFASERGDLLEEPPLEEEKMKGHPDNKSEQFIWLLKWTHIHLFGMSMIFIFMGAITICLDMSPKTRTWLVVLPFIGVLVDIATMWLKAYFSPVFFWLHIPGGGLFGTVFLFVSFRALLEMWVRHVAD